jgi:virginiamycin B lyase
MEAQKSQERGRPWTSNLRLVDRGTKREALHPRNEKREQGYYHSEGQSVQRMMVLGKPEQRTRRISGKQLGNCSEAVDVGHNCGGDDREFLPPIQGSCARDHPAGQKVGDRTHSLCELYTRTQPKTEVIYYGRRNSTLVMRIRKPIRCLTLAVTSCVLSVTAYAQDFQKLDASALPIQAKIHISGGDPDWLATGFGSLWVSVPKRDEIVRIDPKRNVIQAGIRVGNDPCYGIGVGATRLWVLNCKSQTLVRLNPRTNKVDLKVRAVIAPHGEGSIAVDGTGAWYVSNPDGHSSTLVHVDALGRTRAKIPVGEDSVVVNVAFGSVWVTSSGEGKVYRVDPKSHALIAKISVAATPRFTTVSDDSIWVLSQSDGSIAHIDPKQNRVIATVQARVPGGGGDIAFGGGCIWAAANGTPVIRIDPKTNRVLEEYGNYKGADAIRFGFGSVWVSDHGNGDVWRIDPGKIAPPQDKAKSNGQAEALLLEPR